MTETDRKRLHVITWGCQMNVYDSGRMADVLAPLGYGPAAEPDGADMVILNTCHIRDKAAEKVFSELGRLRRMKEATGGRMILAVAGCVAQADGARLLHDAPQIDVLFGPGKIDQLPRLLDERATTGRSAYAVGFRKERGAHDGEAAKPAESVAASTTPA